MDLETEHWRGFEVGSIIQYGNKGNFNTGIITKVNDYHVSDHFESNPLKTQLTYSYTHRKGIPNYTVIATSGAKIGTEVTYGYFYDVKSLINYFQDNYAFVRKTNVVKDCQTSKNRVEKSGNETMEVVDKRKEEASFKVGDIIEYGEGVHSMVAMIVNLDSLDESVSECEYSLIDLTGSDIGAQRVHPRCSSIVELIQQCRESYAIIKKVSHAKLVLED